MVPGDAEDPPIDVDMDQEGEEEPLHMPNGTAPECGYFIPPLIYIFLASLLSLFLYYCFHMFPLFIRCEQKQLTLASSFELDFFFYYYTICTDWPANVCHAVREISIRKYVG